MLESYPREELSVLVERHIGDAELVVLLKFDQVISSPFGCNFLGKGGQEIDRCCRAFDDRDVE